MVTTEKKTRTVFWRDGAVCNIDQKLLPYEYRINEMKTAQRVCDEILDMGIRGSTAIGVAGAYAVVLAVNEADGDDVADAMRYLERESDRIAKVRPTATKLKYAVSRVMNHLRKAAPACATRQELYDEALACAHDYCEEEVDVARRLVENLAGLMPEDGSIITHCNTGRLCNVAYGGAAAGAMLAHHQGKNVHVYVDETRPRLQGAKLNVYELQEDGTPYTLITDNMAAYVMAQGLVDAVFVGADKVAQNGDTAAKIGVLGLAAIAKNYGIPVYMSASLSGVDFNLRDGSQIVIEQRDPEEVRVVNGSRIVAQDVPVLNPAFDVTPGELLTAIVTEEGVARPPYKVSLKEMYEKKKARFAGKDV